MGYYLLFFGILVMVLLLVGVFYTISEFKEMSDNPKEYKKSQDKINIS